MTGKKTEKIIIGVVAFAIGATLVLAIFTNNALGGMGMHSMSMQSMHDHGSHSHGSEKALSASLQAAVDEVPETLKKLPCYCGCQHESIWECYEEGMMAGGCGVCKDEALMAHELKQQGLSDAEVLEKVKEKYA